MWCCFKIPEIPEAPEEVSEKLETPITEIIMVEPFILDHSTISMEPCEITEN